MENKKMKIGAVVVTYNRLDKLKKALESFEKQLYLPAYVIVADNASTDGTAQYLRQWQKEDAGFKKIILTMESKYGRKRRLLCRYKKGLWSRRLTGSGYLMTMPI